MEIIPNCDVCGKEDHEVIWCGSCGNCSEHCSDQVDCPQYQNMLHAGLDRIGLVK